ncbi:MAG TPA: hydrolase 2, exosortase A system-associated [Burkholderiales bacterium]|nr:hydrolase 2, exosortase A system-associated [Burkholderiales bacterium]
MTRLTGHFIEGTQGPLFVAVREPADDGAGGVRGCVLVVPPFAEEMNKTRRMLAELSIRLADRGIVTVVPDLYGTGDSAGDFGVVDWQTWQRDIGSVAAWAAARGMPVDRLLAVRLGAALALDCIASGNLPDTYRHTVFWQPVFDGARFVTQFLRLRTAASLTAAQKESVSDLRASLQAGQVVDVAGYALSPRLAASVNACAMPEVLPVEFGRVTCIEITRSADVGITAPLAQLCERSVASGGSASTHTVVGEPYWASTEIVSVKGVIDKTCECFTAVDQYSCPDAASV